jgi:hypothetical protein
MKKPTKRAALARKRRELDTIPSARERARTIPNTVPFHRLRTESVILDSGAEEVRLVHDGQRWPSNDEPIEENTVVLALQRGDKLQKGAARIVGRYLRESKSRRLKNDFSQVAVSYRVLAYLADMIDPPEDCAFPFVFQFKRHSDVVFKLARYAQIGRHYCAVLRELEECFKSSPGKTKKKGRGLSDAAVKQTTKDLGVSKTDVYRALRVIRGKSPE